MARRDPGAAWTRRQAAAGLAVSAAAASAPGARGEVRIGLPFRALPPGPGALDNPLKGWAAYAEDWARHHLPVAMAYFYVPWRALEPAPGQFAFAEWEQRAWSQPLARDKHIVFRVYLDSPGLPTGVPQWLLDRGVKLTPYRDAGGETRGDDSAGVSPDYADPRLVDGLERLVAALGARYDGHPRIAFIALGLLGHWGEWHTYPREDLAPPPATQRRVLAAYRLAFAHKKLLARYPGGEAGAADWLGYHDDAFPDATGGAPAWHFINLLRSAGRAETWRRHPIAGEMVPNAAPRLLGPGFATTVDALRRARLSWLGPYCPALEAGIDALQKARAETLVRMMGYDFRLLRVWAPETAARGGRIAIAIDLVNLGLAPFYYPWPVEMALLGPGGAVALRHRLAADPRDWLPGEATIAGEVPADVPPGRYRLGLGILDPWRSRPAIGFANDLPRDQGWTILGSVAVT